MLLRWRLAGDNHGFQMLAVSSADLQQPVCAGWHGVFNFLRVCTDADVMKLAHITVLDRPALTFVHTHKQTVLHADTHGAWQPGGGGRMQGLAVPLCV